MVSEVVLHKVTSLERCVRRAREELNDDPEGFSADLTRQDAAILNVQRACETALDIALILCRRERLGYPSSAAEGFRFLACAGWYSADLAESLGRMVGFRNIAVHEYQNLSLPVVIQIIQVHLEDLLVFARVVLEREPQAR